MGYFFGFQSGVLRTMIHEVAENRELLLLQVVMVTRDATTVCGSRIFTNNLEVLADFSKNV